jgi:hypothetical protein
VALAEHSLVIHGREDAECILRPLIDRRIDLRRLILKNCYLGNDSTGLLTNIIAVYPDLEVLSLESCHPITSASYSLIPRLKKLSELNLSNHHVSYVYVKLLETHVCIHFRTPLEYILYIYARRKFTEFLRHAA